MKPTMFFLTNSIDLERGGLTKASMKQASIFAEMGYDTHMLTFNFNPDYPRIRYRLQKLNRIHKNVNIRNLYEELAHNQKPVISRQPVKQAQLDKLTNGMTAVKRKYHKAYRLFHNGMYKQYIAYRNNKSLHFIDYFNENRYRTKRELYDSWSRLKRTDYMDLTYNKPRQSIYYDNKQRAYLTRWDNPEEGITQRIMLFNQNGSVKRGFIPDEETLKLEWLYNTIDRLGGKQSVVISDTRSTDELLIQLNHPKAAKIWRLHSSHLDKPFKVDSPITPKVQNGLQHIDEFDAAVLLTEEQKQDINDRYGYQSNMTVVPHFHETNPSFSESIKNVLRKEDEKRCVIVTRLSSIKRISHVIRAFRQVVDELPDVYLEIWGTGKQKKKLKTLIENLDLTQHVYLKGYIYNPDAAYQRALFSLTTSKSEGFALSILESMYNKTPVISYQIKYGPADMIHDGSNGCLVDNQSIDQLAERMIHLFRHPKLAHDMGKKARQTVDKHFNKTHYKAKWLEAVDTALQNKFHSEK